MKLLVNPELNINPSLSLPKQRFDSLSTLRCMSHYSHTSHTAVAKMISQYNYCYQQRKCILLSPYPSQHFAPNFVLH